MSEKNDIKYGQLWARHSELVSNSDVGNYRINFEGLKNAIDEALRDAQTGAVWLKDQHDKLYDQVKGGKQTVCYVDYNVFGSDRVYRDICTIKAETMEFVSRGHGYGSVRHMSGNEKELFIQFCESIHVEWLCEGAAAAGREEDAVKNEAIFFADWGNKNVRGFDPIAGKWVYGDDEKRYTTAELYELFKQKSTP